LSKAEKAVKPSKKEKPPEVPPVVEPEVPVEDIPEVSSELSGTSGEQNRENYPEMKAISDDAGLPAYQNSSGLLARFPDGTVREPTHEELVEMGREIAKRLFSREPVEVAQLQNPDAPPPPKISGNHCRLCASFAGNDPRGALWSDEGLCLTYKHVQKPVLPENHCERFVFNEGLRG